MSDLYAPHGLFAAVGMTTRDDPDLPDATHVRVVPSPLIGFPIAPLELFRVPADDRTIEAVLWRDRDGTVVPSGDLEVVGGYLTAEWEPERQSVDVAVQVDSDETFEGTVSLLDPVGDRVLAQVSAEPFVVAGPRVSRLRIEGRASGPVGLRAWTVSDSIVREVILGSEPVDRLSLPVDGDLAWYAGGLGPDHNVTVVRRGAPRQTTPADDPDAAPASLTEDDEDLRVAAFAERTLERVETMLADPRVHPTQARLLSEAADADQPKQIVDVAASSTLLAQAMDPGHGRYLGLLTALDDVDPPPHAYVAVGLFAIDSQAQLPGGVFVAAALPDVPDLTDRLVARSGADDVVATIADTWGGDVVPRALIAVAGVPRAPDRPAMPQPGLGRARWLAAGDAVSDQFSQELLVDGAPLASLVALGRLSDGAWATAHQTIDLPAPADPPRRAVAMLLGRTGERAPLVPRGLLTDGGVKSGGGTRYRIRLADLFGRFGDAAEIDAPDPEQPLPPAPALQVEVVLDGPEGDEPGRVSPGRVVVRVPVPPIRDLATGSLPIAGAQLTLDGRSEVVSVAPGDPAGTVMLEHTFDLSELGQGETGESTLRATLIDGADRDGPSAETTVRFNDRRRPPSVVTGRGLIWTSRPGPSSEVELRLSWPAAANTRYRAYVADATSLGLTGVTRADVAHAGTERDAGAGLGTRDHFRLLSDEPMSADGGRVTMTELFPRSLHSVQFLRIVPVSDLGREAEFERCRVIPVAVPTDRRPPAPRVRATVDRDGSAATIAIEAVGLDLKALSDAEPGLFEDPPVPDASAPEFRVRRAMGPVGQPLYAPEVGRGALTRVDTDEGPAFAATFRDPGPLPLYVRVSYWAEVRMPAERRLSRTIDVELPPAGSVIPVDPAQVEPMPAPYSRASAPSTVTGPPGTTAPALTDAGAMVSADAGSVAMTLSATASPVAHPLAPRGFALRLWERWGSGDLVPAGPDVALSGGPLEWTGVARPDPGDQPAALVYAIVAPDGRAGPQHELPAPREAWEGLGGQFISAPTLCSPAAQQLSVLGVGLDSLTYERRFDGQRWDAGWSPISTTVLTSAPVSSASAHDGTVWLATFRDESAILFRRVGGVWTPQAAGPITSAKAMVALDDGKVRQFGVWSTGVHESTWDGAAWSSVQRLPGPFTSVPDVAALATGSQVDLVIRARDGSVHHRRHANGAWGPWRRLGEFVASAGPAIARLDGHEIAVLAPGQQGRLHWTRLRADGETPWTRISSVPVVGAPAVTSTANRLDVVVQRTDGQYYRRWYDGAWHP